MRPVFELPTAKLTQLEHMCIDGVTLELHIDQGAAVNTRSSSGITGAALPHRSSCWRPQRAAAAGRVVHHQPAAPAAPGGRRQLLSGRARPCPANRPDCAGADRHRHRGTRPPAGPHPAQQFAGAVLGQCMARPTGGCVVLCGVAWCRTKQRVAAHVALPLPTVRDLLNPAAGAFIGAPQSGSRHWQYMCVCVCVCAQTWHGCACLNASYLPVCACVSRGIPFSLHLPPPTAVPDRLLPQAAVPLHVRH